MSDEFIYEGMTPDLQVYLDHHSMYSKASQDGEYKAWKEKKDLLDKLLPEGLAHRYYSAMKVWQCRDATATTNKDTGEVNPPKVIKSESGRYEFHLTQHSQGKNYWNYSKARVFRAGELIAEVCRNYGSFPKLFVEGHPNGHDYLICGEDYQGQTVIELDTGRRRDFLPKEAKEGHGFCWSSYEFHQPTQMLVVDGCYWAGPYEFKFYDFSDPMEKGWPLLETEVYIDADRKAPVLGEDGTITTYETKWEHPENEDNDDFDEDTAPRVDAVVRKFKREDGKLTLVSEWVSEAEKKRQEERAQAEAKYEAWKANFIATDPLYLAYKERVKDSWLTPEEYYSTGVTHDNWCPDFKEHESRWCRRIAGKRGASKGYTLDYEWAVKTGPVKLTVYKDGNSFETKFWPHTVEGVHAAFDYAKSLVSP